MRVVLLTQDEPLFLAPSVDYLLSRKPHQVHVVGCVVFDPSPLGKKIGIASRAKELLRVFGTAYFLRYAARFAAARARPSRRVSNILRKHGVRELRLEENVNARSSLGRSALYNRTCWCPSPATRFSGPRYSRSRPKAASTSTRRSFRDIAG